MLPHPLHPAIVHLPMALVILLPLITISALIAMRRGVRPARAWALVLGTILLLVITSWIAIQTGEGEEDAVEDIVAEQYLERHEEAATQFLALGGIVLVLSAVGLAQGRLGLGGRALGVIGTIALLAAGLRVGKLGGELVYTHGAAAAYVTSSSDALTTAGRSDADSADDGEDRRERVGERH